MTIPLPKLTSYLVLLDGDEPFTPEEFLRAQQFLVEWWKSWLSEYLRLYDEESSREVRSRLVPGGEGICISILVNPDGFQCATTSMYSDFLASTFPQHFTETAYFCMATSYLPSRDGSGVFVFTDTADFVQIPPPSTLTGPSRDLLAAKDDPCKLARERVEQIRSNLSLLLELERAIGESDANRKGKKLESVLVKVIETTSGLVVVDRNVRTETEEIDIVVRNESPDPFWSKLSTHILFECKNWSSRVDKDSVVAFRDKLQERRGAVKVGYIIAVNGFTKDAKIHMLRWSREDVVVVPVDRDDLQELIISKQSLTELRRLFEAEILR